MRWIVLFLVGCTTQAPEGERLDALEARVAAVEQQNQDLQARVVRAEAAQAQAAPASAPQTAPASVPQTGGPPDEAVPPLSLRGLELRVQDLERRHPPAPAAAAPVGPEAVGLPVMEVDPETGALVPRLDEAATVSCAADFVNGVRTAETAYDAAFDAYSEDFEVLGWAPDPANGCAAYVAVAAEVDAVGVDVIAVVTRGRGRGRQFRATVHEAPREAARLDETGIATFLAGHRWTGSAR